MKNRLNYFFHALVPFLIIGITIAMLLGLLIMFSYLLVWGILIGGMLWLASIIKNFLFPKKAISESEGRIIEHNDNK
jgi:hypothetical protein